MKRFVCSLILCFCLPIGILWSCSDTKHAPDPGNNPVKPVIDGWMIYHSYSSYEASDSHLFLYDFTTSRWENLSSRWQTVKHAMNAHLSPDGTECVFMGIGTESNTWDLFRFRLGQSGEPELLTPHSVDREEDPKYDPTGRMIVYKRNRQLMVMTLNQQQVRPLTADPSSEYSMPYFTADGQWVICSKDSGAGGSIIKVRLADGKVEPLCDRPGVADYYPIGVDASCFYFTSHYSAQNRHDQLFRGYYDGRFPDSFPFNRPDADYSDGYPAGNDWVLLSSTKTGGQGGYDLYLGHSTQGVLFSLNDYHRSINTPAEELGASLYLRNVEVK